jgi:hypothetical protein
MLNETDFNVIGKDMDAELETYLNKTSDSVSFDTVQYNPVLEQFAGIIDALLVCLDVAVRREEMLSKVQKAMKEDVEKEMLDLKEQLEKLPDSHYKKTQLMRLNINLASLNRL